MRATVAPPLLLILMLARFHIDGCLFLTRQVIPGRGPAHSRHTALKLENGIRSIAEKDSYSGAGAPAAGNHRSTAELRFPLRPSRFKIG
jgi:hypothetical protein